MKGEPVFGRFHAELVAQYATAHAHNIRELLERTRAFSSASIHEGTAETIAHYRNLHSLLTSLDTKRMAFDARQAQVFDGTPLRLKGHDKVRPPFRRLYMEFTDPIYLQAQEPGMRDATLGFVFISDYQMDAEYYDGHEWRKGPVSACCFFQRCRAEDWAEQLRKTGADVNPGDFGYCERLFAISPEGLPLVSARAVLGFQGEDKQIGLPLSDAAKADVSEVPDPFLNDEGIDKDTGAFPRLFKACDPLGDPGRKIGWWERAIASYASLVWWCFAFTMAKSVLIIEKGPCRQARRLALRENRPPPQPWHVVTVEPCRIVRDDGGGSVADVGGRHGYRYDVIGFLRFNRHKLKDGTYRDRIEWVQDHQRGLRNDVYIPKGWKVDAHEPLANEAKEYFG